MASAFAIFLLFIAAPASAGMSDAELSDAELKGRLIDSYFYADEGESWQNFRHFTELSAVTDEQLHRVLMEIYNEADDKLQTLTPGSGTTVWGWLIVSSDGFRVARVSPLRTSCWPMPPRKKGIAI
jgi:hypothetical protein